MRWIWLTLAALVVLIAVAFTRQNSAYQVPLQLDLWVTAWKLRSPVAVPVLMWSSFGAGAVLTAGLLGIRGMAQGRRIRQLEQEVALGGTRAPAKDPWAG